MGTNEEDRQMTAGAVGAPGPASVALDQDSTYRRAGRVLVGVLATYLIGGFVLFPPTSDEMGEPIGNCFVLSSSWCTSLAVEQLEALSGVEFPAHAEVINSGSSGFLLTGHDWATVRWPEGTSVPEGLTSTRFRGEVSGGSDFAWIDASWTDLRERYETIVHVGVGTDGRPQLSLRRTWNG